MKRKNFLSGAFVVLILVLLGSCASPHKVAGPSGNVDLKGTWTLNNIDYEGASKSSIKVTVFDDALASCFIGSQWTLIQNGNGSYNIQSPDQGCNTGERKIYWSVQNVDGTQYFQFKKLFEGDKASKVTDGYRLQVKSIDANSMVLQSSADLDGKTIYINYHYSK